ncbi:hypothetical protein [Variovorax sp. 770b2]|uniref:hypothetical protein n=1 Tax=Variovorax sp. 770b2 TaxID=1566271 RepID=UPI0008EE1E65|nr:hypothetical protein [Variovorax sp. 770b2]SFQ41069.1 hypothetical protein SAMN03159339_0383 [Variovorax sp. 770b2]
MTLIAHIHRLLLDHCTRAADNDERSRTQRQRYIDRVQRVLTTSRLAPRAPHEVWASGWDKPFFAYNAAAQVDPAVNLARQSGVLENPTEVASTAFLDDGKFGTLVQAGIAHGQLTGACAVTWRLQRVQNFARAVPRITEAVNRFHDEWLTGTLEVDALQARAVAIAEDIGIGGGPIGKVSGFGFTTACHLLADLGLPVFKPDIWVCRIVSMLPNVQAEIRRTWRLGNGPVPFDYLESKLVGSRAPNAYRRIVQPVMNALVAEAQEVAVEELDLTPAFLRARFVDWTLVHFAISTEAEGYGLERRPVDLLSAPSCDLATPGYIHALARWLQDAQATHEAVNALVKAKQRLQRADTPVKKDRAERRLKHLLTQDAQAMRDALQARALEASIAYENAVFAARWQIAPRYPDGFASDEGSNRWKYIHAARTVRTRDVAV